MTSQRHIFWHAGNRRRLAGAAFLVCAAHPAIAQEYCVACTAPDVLYRCVIDGARPGAANSLQMLCITALAKDGNHATCAVSRGTGVIDCNGPIKHVAAVPGDGTVAGAVVVPPQTPVPKASEPKGDPKTVAEMLKRAKEQNDKSWEKTNDQIKSNNQKIGGFFAKSWACVASLFVHCSGE